MKSPYIKQKNVLFLTMVSLLTFHKSPIKQVGAHENLLVKDHTHTFVNRGGEIGGRLWCLIFHYQIVLKVIINPLVFESFLSIYT